MAEVDSPQFFLVIDYEIGSVEVGWTKDQAVCGLSLEVNTETLPLNAKHLVYLCLELPYRRVLAV